MKLGRNRIVSPTRRLIISLPLVLLAMLSFSPAAHAAIGLSDLAASPTNTDAGAKSDFHAHLTVTNSADQLRDLTVGLPSGLSGNPQSVAKCTATQLNADACPSGSQVGTTSVGLTASGLVPLTVDGSIYNVVPQTGEPARLGIVLRPPDPTHLLLPPIIQQVKVNLRPDFGLDTVLTDLPQNAAVLGMIPVPIAITSIDLNLDGSFMQNPTSCGTKTTNFAARSYAMSASDPAATGSATFESTNCAAQPYSPNATIDVNGDGTELNFGARPTVTSVITQSAGEANNKRAAVVLPAALGFVVDHLEHVCTPADFQAGNCAADTKVGNATAVSPLLDSDLTGSVYLVTGAVFPQVGVDLKGALPLKLMGSTGLKVNQLETVFDGLPDLPLSKFELTFPGGSNSLLSVFHDVCAADSTFSVDFTSQADQKLTKTGLPHTTNCPAGGFKIPGSGDGGTTNPPSNKFTFGKTTVNKKKGVATLRVKVPGAGKVKLVGSKTVKASSKAAKAKSTIKLTVRARGKAAKALKKKAKAKVKAKVTFTPTGGTAKTKSKSVKLVKRIKRAKR